MYSTEISKCLSKLNVPYNGLYPRDLLPRSIHTLLAFVVNTDPHTRPGFHWTATYTVLTKIKKQIFSIVTEDLPIVIQKFLSREL